MVIVKLFFSDTLKNPPFTIKKIITINTETTFLPLPKAYQVLIRRGIFPCCCMENNTLSITLHFKTVYQSFIKGHPAFSLYIGFYIKDTC